MALTITITDPRIIQILEAEAASAGISESEAVEHAIARQHEIDRAGIRTEVITETPTQRDARWHEAMDILTEIHKTVTDEDRAFDYDAWLYDEHGAPH